MSNKKTFLILLAIVTAAAIICGVGFNFYSRSKYSPFREPETRVSTKLETTTQSTTKPGKCAHGHEYTAGATCGCKICMKEGVIDKNCQLEALYKKVTITCPLCGKNQTFANTIAEGQQCKKCHTIYPNQDKDRMVNCKCKSCSAQLQICYNSTGLKNVNVKINGTLYAAEEAYKLTKSCRPVDYKGTTYFYYADDYVTYSKICTCGKDLGISKAYVLYTFNGDRMTKVSGDTGLPYYAGSNRFYTRNGKVETMYRADGSLLKQVDHTDCQQETSSTTYYVIEYDDGEEPEYSWLP